MSKPIIHFLLTCIVIFGVSQASAEELIEELVVQSTLVKNSGTLSNRVPSWSLDRESISLQTTSNSLDLLRQAPGISVTQQGGAGGLSFVSVHAGEPNFTKVMIDGVDVDNPNQ